MSFQTQYYNCFKTLTLNSFIVEIYIAPFQGCYSGALPIPARLKRTVFRLSRVECVRMNPGEQSLRPWRSMPHGRANHRECLVEERAKRTPFHRAVETATSGAHGWTAKILQVVRNKAQQTPPDQGINLEYDPPLEG